MALLQHIIQDCSGSSGGGGSSGSSTVTAAGATVARTLENHFANVHYAADWGVVADGKQIFTCDIANASDQLSSTTYDFIEDDEGATFILTDVNHGTPLTGTISSVASGVATLSGNWAGTTISNGSGRITFYHTDNTTALQTAIDDIVALHDDDNGHNLTGFKLVLPKGVVATGAITIPRLCVISAAGQTGSTIWFAKSGTNGNCILSENFATLTGTEAVYGTNVNVPSWFGLENVVCDFNKAGQTAGNGLAWYGNAPLALGHCIFMHAYQDNLFTESAGGYAYNGSDWRSQEEGFFDHLTIRGAGRYGWLNRGPHDSTIVNCITYGNASTGYRAEMNGTVYIGSAHIHFIHSYANVDGTGMYFGCPSTIMEAYSDFDNVTVAASEVIFDKLYQIQMGVGGLNGLEFTSAAKYCTIANHVLNFKTDAEDVIGVNIQSGSGPITIANSICSITSGTSGITGYKVRSNFNIINAHASNLNTAFDITAAYTRITGHGFSNDTDILYGGGNNNVIQWETYGSTTELSGSAGTTDVFHIGADTGYRFDHKNLSMYSPFDSSGQIFFNIGNMISGYYINGYQTQFTFKGAEANDAYSYQTPTTGFSITIGLSNTYTLLNPAGTLATGTITMPGAPVNGQKAIISSTEEITSLTVSPNTSQSLENPPDRLPAGGTIGWIYRTSDTTWYRINSSAIATGPGFTITNDTTDRTFDANSTSLDELADIVATLIKDLGLDA